MGEILAKAIIMLCVIPVVVAVYAAILAVGTWWVVVVLRYLGVL